MPVGCAGHVTPSLVARLRPVFLEISRSFALLVLTLASLLVQAQQRPDAGQVLEQTREPLRLPPPVEPVLPKPPEPRPAMPSTPQLKVKAEQFSFSGTGQSDTTNGRLQMTMDFSGLPAQLSQHGSTAEFVLADKVMYLKLPFLSGMLPGGKQWMKVDLSAAARQAGTSLGSFGQLDPQQWLQQLLASSDTQKLGTDTVQGEQMTHYRTTIDPSKLTANVPAAQRAAVRKAMKQIGMSTIPVDVWVDGKGLLRQESLSLSLGQGLQNATMKMTFDLHDFGEPVSVEVPPADQVFDATDLATQGAASALNGTTH